MSRVKVQPWDQQAEETNPAFAAYRCYFELGGKRSLKAVAQKLSKSLPLMKRWSKRWKWPERIRKQTKVIVDSVDRQTCNEVTERQLPDLMGEVELLFRVSMLARADPLMVLDDEGNLDIKQLRKSGLGYLLSSVETVTTKYPNGAVTVRKKFKLEPRSKFLELMGKHLGVWTGEITDWDALLARLANTQPHLLPSSLDVPGQVVESPLLAEREDEK